jgi:hypothetical protein
MKKLIITLSFFLIVIAVQAQGNKTVVLQDLEKSQPLKQDQQVTATLKSASRLFGAMDDLTSVILIIPSGSVVEVLGSDSTYFKVLFEENEGYIFKRHAVLNNIPVEIAPQNQQENLNQVEQKVEQNVEQPADQKQVSRFTYLENKYGTKMAVRLATGKIWRGMSADMVRDSWGAPLKINRAIGEIVKEEWIYKNSWLYIENNTLVEWGPIRK